jgi:acyl-CoA thioester hydrolase
VYYEDTDSGGVVYYANYLKFMERARTELLRHLGYEQDQLLQQHGIIFAVRHASLEFIKPARFNELLQVTAGIKKTGKASMTFAQRVMREAEILCEGQVKVACLAADGFRPVPIPTTLMQQLQREYSSVI